MIGYGSRLTRDLVLAAQHRASVFKNESVTNAVHGFEVNGMGRVWLEFLTQPQNAVIDRAGAGIVFKAPDLIQEFVPRDRPPGLVT